MAHTTSLKSEYGDANDKMSGCLNLTVSHRANEFKSEMLTETTLEEGFKMRTEETSEGASKSPRTSMHLLRDLFPVYLVVTAFSLDMTLYLPTVNPYIESIVGIEKLTYYFSLTQSVSSAAQIITSFSIGYVAEKIGSIKWVFFSLMSLYVVGNVLYSIGSPSGLNSIVLVIVGRILCSVAEGSVGLGSSYIALVTTEEERLPAMSQYRSFMGFALIGPGLSSLFGLCDFYIGSYNINAHTAPTLFTALLMFAFNMIILFRMKDRKTKAASLLKGIQTFFRPGPLSLLFLQLFSSFSIATTQYLMPATFWQRYHFDTGLQGGLMVAIGIVALSGALFSHKLHSVFEQFSRTKQAEVHMTAFAFGISTVAYIGMLLAIRLDSEPATIGGKLVWIIACTLLYTAYNLQSSIHPSIFSKIIDPTLVVSLMPWLMGVFAVGKIIAPAVAGPLFPWLAYIAPLAMGILGFAIAMLARNTLSTSK
ncbi:uncharacterized protein VTP21DRAFT_917 [Calcarisporiella thermophila]|uniref:uncharacterized protein n=1 Tax=Calcarisporiella thermophila TaxID=911321 RepID=UPI00374425A7